MPLKHEDIPALSLKWAKGDAHAAEFLTHWARIVRVADDLADGDSTEPVADMSELLLRTLAFVPLNPFFLTHQQALTAVMVNAILLWRKSEFWRKAPATKTRMFGFVGREACEHVVYTVASITGGPTHALEVMDELHVLSHLSNTETLEDWEAE